MSKSCWDNIEDTTNNDFGGLGLKTTGEQISFRPKKVLSVLEKLEVTHDFKPNLLQDDAKS